MRMVTLKASGEPAREQLISPNPAEISQTSRFCQVGAEEIC